MHAQSKRIALGTVGCSLLTAPLFFTSAVFVLVVGGLYTKGLRVVLVPAGGGGGGGNHRAGIIEGFGGGGGGLRRGGVCGRLFGSGRGGQCPLGGQGLSNRATAISTNMCG